MVKSAERERARERLGESQGFERPPEPSRAFPASSDRARSGPSEAWQRRRRDLGHLAYRHAEPCRRGVAQQISGCHLSGTGIFQLGNRFLVLRKRFYPPLADCRVDSPALLTARGISGRGVACALVGAFLSA